MSTPLKLNCDTIRKLGGFDPHTELDETWVCANSGRAATVCVPNQCRNTLTFDTYAAMTVDSVPHPGVPLHIIALAILHDAIPPKK